VEARWNSLHCSEIHFHFLEIMIVKITAGPRWTSTPLLYCYCYYALLCSTSTLLYYYSSCSTLFLLYCYYFYLYYSTLLYSPPPLPPPTIHCSPLHYTTVKRRVLSFDMWPCRSVEIDWRFEWTASIVTV
jgi:hypothetical protein